MVITEIMARKGRFNLLSNLESISIHIKGIKGFEEDYVNLSWDDLNDWDYIKQLNHSVDINEILDIIQHICDKNFVWSTDKTMINFINLIKREGSEVLRNELNEYVLDRKNRRIEILEKEISLLKTDAGAK